MKKYVILLCFLCCLVFVGAAHAKAPLNFYLGLPYIVNPLGEGEQSPYAKGPLFREDGFDCTTYVEALLGQFISVDKRDFQSTINLLRYIGGEIDFFKRTHFMEYHWIPNALKNGFIVEYPLKNIKKTEFNINLQEWFLKNNIVSNKDDEYMQMALRQPSRAQASVAYIASEDITSDFVESLPDFMVVFFIKEIAAHSWLGQAEEQELITHMGILKEGQLYHASIKHKKVYKIALVDYVRSVPAFVGVSFYMINN